MFSVGLLPIVESNPLIAFWEGVAIVIVWVYLVLFCVVIAPELVRTSWDWMRDALSPARQVDGLEDDEARLVASRQRRRELDAAAVGLRHVDADSLDGRRLNEILTTMPSPPHAQTRIH